MQWHLQSQEQPTFFLVLVVRLLSKYLSTRSTISHESTAHRCFTYTWHKRKTGAYSFGHSVSRNCRGGTVHPFSIDVELLLQGKIRDWKLGFSVPVLAYRGSRGCMKSYCFWGDYRPHMKSWLKVRSVKGCRCKYSGNALSSH